MSAAAALLVASCLAAAPSEAERLSRAGEAAYAAGEYLAAAQALEQAYELSPQPAVAFALAQAYRLQYFVDRDPAHLDRAIVLYRIYLDATPRGGHRTEASSALAGLEPLKLRLDDERAAAGPLAPENLVPYEPPTQLIVISDVAGARASLDGGPPAELPLVAKVRPGPHAVVVSAPGHHPAGERPLALQGRIVVVQASLRAKPGRLAVRGEEGAQVWLDGKRVGQLPLPAPLEVSGGSHRVAVTRGGRIPWANEVEVARGASVQVAAELEPTVQREVSYWVMGGGAAAIGAAGILGILALGDQQQATLLLDRREQSALTPAELADYSRLAERRDDRATAAWILAGSGAAVGLAGVLLHYLDRGGPPPSTGWLAAVAPNTSAPGLTLSGRF